MPHTNSKSHLTGLASTCPYVNHTVCIFINPLIIPVVKTEHIDNPKGYGEGEDPRKYHPALRGPVDPRELEIDPQTGMKNYIANGTSA